MMSDVLRPTDRSQIIPEGNSVGDMILWNGSRYIATPTSFPFLTLNKGEELNLSPLIIKTPSQAFAIYVLKSDATTALMELDDTGLFINVADVMVMSAASGLKGFVFEQPDGAIKLLGAPSLTTSQTITFPEQTGTVALLSDIPAAGGATLKYASVAAQVDKTTTTLSNINALAIAVEAGLTYSFRAVLFTTSNVAGGVKASIGGDCTATTIIYEGDTFSAGAITQTRASSMGTMVGGVTAVTTATIIIEGTIIVNGAGNLTPGFACNAAVGTSSVLVGSYFQTIRS